MDILDMREQMLQYREAAFVSATDFPRLDFRDVRAIRQSSQANGCTM
jgi:hypothetical protein